MDLCATGLEGRELAAGGSEVLVARLQPLVQQERRRIFGDLSDHQLAAFRAVLDHLESVLER